MLNDDLKEKESRSTGYGGGFRASYSKEEEFSDLSVPESGERTDSNEVLLKLERIEKHMEKYEDFNEQVTDIRGRLEQLEHYRSELRKSPKAPLEISVKRWLKIARNATKILAVLTENLDVAVNSVLQLSKEQSTRTDTEQDNEQVDLSGLLPVLNRLLKELSATN